MALALFMAWVYFGVGKCRWGVWRIDCRIPRLKRRLLASEVCANRGMTGLLSVTMKDICCLQQPITLPQIRQLNTVWHLSWELGNSAGCHLNWGGFVQSACTGLHAPPAAIAMLSLIDMKLSDDNACIPLSCLSTSKRRNSTCQMHV